MQKMFDEISRVYKEKFTENKFIPGETNVPISGKVFDEREMINMTEAVLDGWWTEGRFVKQFEQKLVAFLGMNYCATVNSGSSANLLAISALTSFRLPEEKRMKPGDEVITVAAGFPTTINPIIQLGFVPVFVDVELGNYNASLETIKKATSPKTRAVFLAHTLGNPYDVAELAAWCKENNYWLIEDNCDALGSKYDGKYTGTFGDVSTVSFYPAHHITMGEGGAVLTNDPFLNVIIRSLRDWGRDCVCPAGFDNVCGNRFNKQLGNLPFGYDHKYTYSEIGYNLKTTDIQAALGLAQLEKLPGFIERRKENFKQLYDNLKKLDKYFILPEWNAKSQPSWFGFPLTLKDGAGFKREELIKFLIDKKIGTRLLFGGNITKQPYFLNYKINYRIAGELINSDKIMNDALWIGTYPGISKEMLDHVINTINEFVKNY
jgi:CDP-6-deoxy-D-xylo-4-hexulose-3-dehydrase